MNTSPITTHKAAIVRSQLIVTPKLSKLSHYEIVNKFAEVNSAQ